MRRCKILDFINYPKKHDILDIKKGHILSDINSHLENPKSFDDNSLVTSAHEKSHLIASDIRNNHKGKAGFYLLNDKAALLDNSSHVTLADIAKAVPTALHGMSFSLYLINAQHDWDHYPNYLFDEFSAYINGSKCGLELNLECDSEILQSIEFSLYTAVLSELSKDAGILEFFHYQKEQAFILHRKHPTAAASNYIIKWSQNEKYKKYLGNKLSDYGTGNFI